ncbi:MAG: group 1 truncated hemoglobin [Mariprofundus sp.]|nr:group 1 truncated hemoglobin [Mariprofundus sp.]
MHLETFIPVFLMFAVFGLIVPTVLAGMAEKGRAVGKGSTAEADATASTADTSLYEQLGGEAAVNAAVDVFYRRVLADAYVVRFFEGVDMEKQAAKQKAFLTMAFGGPHNYSGKDMREGHRHLIKMGLNDSHFEHILMHLRATLAELGVANNLIQQVIAIADSTRDDVLDR